MTNEEKAREFATEQELSNSPNKEHFARDIYSGAILMAQWKDAIFEEKIEELKKNIITARDDKEYYKPKADVALDWVLRLIDELMKEEFDKYQ